jgi:exosome complex RNA-binding protein Csl4
VYGV